jgi:hypothetical protein
MCPLKRQVQNETHDFSNILLGMQWEGGRCKEDRDRGLVHSNMFEIAGTAVLLGEEVGAVVGFARGTAGTLGRVGTVEIRDVVVADVAEPAENNM